jgi:hypothetical protein
MNTTELINNLSKQGIFELLLTRYWELAYLEGKDGVSHGTEAQETLNELRELFAELLAKRNTSPDFETWWANNRVHLSGKSTYEAHKLTFNAGRPSLPAEQDAERLSIGATCFIAGVDTAIKNLTHKVTPPDENTIRALIAEAIANRKDGV